MNSLPEENDSDTDTSSEDWEESLDSEELDFASTESDTDEEELFGEYLPKLSKYLVTY